MTIVEAATNSADTGPAWSWPGRAAVTPDDLPRHRADRPVSWAPDSARELTEAARS